MATQDNNATSTPAALGLPQKLLNRGFIVSLFMSATLMVATASYLVVFLIQTNLTITHVIDGGGADPHVLLATFGLSSIAFTSCGLFIGIALGFLGVALFLMGIKGEIDAESSTEGFSIKLARMSPGALAIVCSVVVVVTCILNRPTLEFDRYGDAKMFVAPTSDDDKK